MFHINTLTNRFRNLRILMNKHGRCNSNRQPTKLTNASVNEKKILEHKKWTKINKFSVDFCSSRSFCYETLACSVLSEMKNKMKHCLVVMLGQFSDLVHWPQNKQDGDDDEIDHRGISHESKLTSEHERGCQSQHKANYNDNSNQDKWVFRSEGKRNRKLRAPRTDRQTRLGYIQHIGRSFRSSVYFCYAVDIPLSRGDSIRRWEMYKVKLRGFQ